MNGQMEEEVTHKLNGVGEGKVKDNWKLRLPVEK